MPLINVELIEDVFTPDQKREIVERPGRCPTGVQLAARADAPEEVAASAGAR
jgi:hypothetical protein